MTIKKSTSFKSALTLKTDVVVVGTGAGGGMMIHELARQGVKVIGLEMGSEQRPQTFNQREDEMFERLLQQRGAQASDDLKIRLLTGIGVGGSTVHNTNLCKRTPSELLDIWQRDHDLKSLDRARLDDCFKAVEALLEVKKLTDADLNRNNQLFRKGVEALGYAGGLLSHNRTGCIRSGFCELGCSYDAKNNSAKVLIPAAMKSGAEIYSGFRVDTVEQKANRAIAVHGTMVDPDTQSSLGSFTVQAKAVCLAGSAIRSPLILQSSSIQSHSGLTGQNFRCHPGAIVAALFDEEVNGWKGIPQGYECTEFLDQNDPKKNCWLIPGFAHPIGTAAMVPGFGAAHMALMRQYPNLAAVIVMLDETASGSVSWRSEGRLAVRHQLNAFDREQIVKGMEGAAKIMFGAGAREVIVPYHHPLRLKNPSEISQIRARGLPDYDLALTGVHPMGTLKMGDNPATSVVNSNGQHHQLKGLFVCDGSVFPTALGAPPQISIYSFARYFAPAVIDFLSQ